MTYIPIYYRNMTRPEDREVWLAGCINWLINNVGVRYKDWGINRNSINGRVLSFWIKNPEDAIIFKLTFEI